MKVESILRELSVDPLPVLSACYCGKCKTPLTRDRVIDDQHAWCPNCNATVKSSAFQVPSWIIGVVAILFLYNTLSI